MSLNKSEIYKTVSNELEKRANKKDVAIKWIKGELFDTLTFWSDKVGDKEACQEILSRLEKKRNAAKKANVEGKNDQYIANLKFIIDDTKNRMKKWEWLKFDTKKEEWKKYIDLNKWGFNEKVLDTVAKSIVESAKGSDKIDDILIKRLIENEKYREELKTKLEAIHNSTDSGLNKTQKKNLGLIIKSLEWSSSKKTKTGETGGNTTTETPDPEAKSKESEGGGKTTKEGSSATTTKTKKKGTAGGKDGGKTKNDKIDALKDLMINEKDQAELKKNREEKREVEYRLEIIAMNKNNDRILKEILKKQKEKTEAEKNKNKDRVEELEDELYKLRKEIKNLCGQRDEIFYKYFWEKYDDNDVNKFKRIVKPFVKTKEKYEWQDVYGVMSPFRKHRKTRRKLNYVIAWMNRAGKNSERWIMNIMCRCQWEEVNPKEIYNWIRARHLLRTNPTKFWEIYKEQKTKFIEDFINELKGDKERLSESDKKTIDQVKKRLDWYEEDFNRRHTAPIK